MMVGLETCAPPADSDADGMPDAWESANSLDPDVVDHDTVMPSGYTAIEVFINELAEEIVEL